MFLVFCQMDSPSKKQKTLLHIGRIMSKQPFKIGNWDAGGAKMFDTIIFFVTGHEYFEEVGGGLVGFCN